MNRGSACFAAIGFLILVTLWNDITDKKDKTASVIYIVFDFTLKIEIITEEYTGCETWELVCLFSIQFD